MLGLLQGFTEFLPVSSSGHLVLAQSFLPNFSPPGILFEVVVHAGTLLATLVYFWKEIVKIKSQYFFTIALGSIPAAIIGFLLSDYTDTLFGSLTIVGFALLITAAFNFFTDRLATAKKTIGKTDSLLIGIAQAVAIVPGISRSGATIFAATSRKIKPQEAAKFSFLLSIPAVVGANLLEFTKFSGQAGSFVPYLVGFTAAAMSGILAIHLVIGLLKEKKFIYFGIYALIVGILTIVLG
jgi:undecaprenyl-diphosphatase